MNTANALYHGWEADTVRERNGDDATNRPGSVFTSFTAINQQLSQSLAATVPAQQNSARRRATSTARRRHNPAVAQYLGLGSANEPTQLQKYAPLPAVPDSPPPKPVRKRRKLADGEHVLCGTRAKTGKKNAPNQWRVPESFPVSKASKPSRKTAAARSKTVASDASRLSTRETDTHATINESIAPRDSHQIHAEASQEIVSASPVQHLIDLQMFDLEDDLNEPSHIDCSLPQPKSTDSIFEDDDYNTGIDDDDLIKLTSEVEVPRSDGINNASSSPVKLGSRVYDSQRLAPGSFASTLVMLKDPSTKSNSSQRSSKQFVSPVTLTTKLLAATGDVGSARAQKPIVRAPFPEAVRDRSPIIGLSSNALLRTCFRIGEVINQSCKAVKSGKNIMIELYARVLASERTDTEQHFTFCDLWSFAKPPYIKGVYNAVIWKSVQLFEYDSKRLLKQGRMCRCIGTVKRDGKEWVMTVLNIWEATWEDIEWVEGIVNM